ncbi:MAG: HAD family hydrolase [Betaproteobacteria bacterium]
MNAELAAIVFDFDGVIANSEPLHCRAFREVLAGEGITLTEPDYYGRYLGYDDVGVFHAIGVDHGVRWDVDHIAALVDRKAARIETLEREIPVLFAGAAAAIRRAAAAVPVAIASGALRAEILRVLDRADLTSAFAGIVAAEDTPASKPAPDPYVRAIDLLSRAAGAPVEPHACVAIEDSRWGLASARAAGLRTVAVTSTYPVVELAGVADLVIESLASLDLAVLRRLVARRPA